MTQKDEEAMRQILGSQVQADAKDAETFVAKHVVTIDDQGNDNAEDLRFGFLAGIAHERAKHRWISVKERLPESSNGKYLVWVGDKWPSQGPTVVDFHPMECPKFSNLPEGAITHWMPLPEPPEEE